MMTTRMMILVQWKMTRGYQGNARLGGIHFPVNQDYGKKNKRLWFLSTQMKTHVTDIL